MEVLLNHPRCEGRRLWPSGRRCDYPRMGSRPPPKLVSASDTVFVERALLDTWARSDKKCNRIADVQGESRLLPTEGTPNNSQLSLVKALVLAVAAEAPWKNGKTFPRFLDSSWLVNKEKDIRGRA